MYYQQLLSKILFIRIRFFQSIDVVQLSVSTCLFYPLVITYLNMLEIRSKIYKAYFIYFTFPQFLFHYNKKFAIAYFFNNLVNV
jgi:hypothetical protein